MNEGTKSIEKANAAFRTVLSVLLFYLLTVLSLSKRDAPIAIFLAD